MKLAELPEVKQCTDPTSPRFGAVAVKLPDNSPLGDYGVMTTNNGGYFARADEVEDWPSFHVISE